MATVLTKAAAATSTRVASRSVLLTLALWEVTATLVLAQLEKVLLAVMMATADQRAVTTAGRTVGLGWWAATAAAVERATEWRVANALGI